MLKRRLPWSRLWDRRDFRAFAAGDDDVAFVKLESHDAGYVALRFCGERLQCFAFGREPEAVNQLAVFWNEGVARVHSHSAATTAAAGESSPSCSNGDLVLFPPSTSSQFYFGSCAEASSVVTRIESQPVLK